MMQQNDNIDSIPIKQLNWEDNILPFIDSILTRVYGVNSFKNDFIILKKEFNEYHFYLPNSNNIKKLFDEEGEEPEILFVNKNNLDLPIESERCLLNYTDEFPIGNLLWKNINSKSNYLLIWVNAILKQLIEYSPSLIQQDDDVKIKKTILSPIFKITKQEMFDRNIRWDVSMKKYSFVPELSICNLFTSDEINNTKNVSSILRIIIILFRMILSEYQLVALYDKDQGRSNEEVVNAIRKRYSNN